LVSKLFAAGGSLSALHLSNKTSGEGGWVLTRRVGPACGLDAHNGGEAGLVVLCDIGHALQVDKSHRHLHNDWAVDSLYTR